MSSEIDHPRQRTVAELLAEHGGGDAATGRRRRRREAELTADEDPTAGAGAPPAAPQWTPDRSVLRDAVPPEPGEYGRSRPAPDGFRPGGPGPAPDAGGGFDRDPNGPDGRAPARWDGAPRDDLFGGAGGRGRGPADDAFGGDTGRGAPRWNGAAPTGAFNVPNGPPPRWNGAPPPGGDPSGSGGFRRVGDPGAGPNGEPDRRNGRTAGTGEFRAEPGRNGQAGGTGAFRLDPGPGAPPRRRAPEPDGSLFAPPGRPEPPPVSGPQTQVVAPVAPERTEQMPRMRRDGTAMIDPLLTAPITQQDEGARTAAVRPPAEGRRRRGVDDDGPSTELSSLPELDDDHPAGLDVEGMRSPSPRRSERAAPSSGHAWAAVVAQWIVGAIGGAALWVGFRFLWQYLPVVAIAAAALVTVGLVLVVRHLLRNDDRRTTLFAVLVGLLLTVSPALLVLLHRT